VKHCGGKIQGIALPPLVTQKATQWDWDPGAYCSE